MNLNSILITEIARNARSSASVERGLTREQREQQDLLTEQFLASHLEISRGAIIPFFEHRAMTATGTTSTTLDQGGVTIAQVVPEIGDAFRDESVLGPLGASITFGHVGNSAYPRELPNTSAAWTAENVAVTASAATFGTMVIAPARVAAWIDASDQWIMQGPANEPFARRMLARGIAEVIQRAAINGLGSGNEPTGILNNSGLTKITDAGGQGSAPTYEDLIDLENIVTGTGKSGQANTGWLFSPKMRKTLRKTYTTTNSGAQIKPVMAVGSADELLGYPAGVTTSAPDDILTGSKTTSAIIFGKWSELFVDFFGPGIIVDAVRILSTPTNVPGFTRIVARAYVGIGVRTIGVFAAKPDCLEAYNP